MTNQEIQYLLDDWKKNNKKPTTEEKIAMLRKEIRMTRRVYGRKVSEAGSPHEKKYKEAVNNLCLRLWIIEELGAEQKAKLGDQQTLFNDKEK